jgi:hypothetical protein
MSMVLYITYYNREPRQLLIPPAAIKDPKSVEILRAWVADEALHCSLKIGVWQGPAAWGVLLADVARHVANAHHEQEGRDTAACLATIRDAFGVELDNPTDAPSGDFL